MSQDDSKIEQLKKDLYSNSTDGIRAPKRTHLHPHAPIVNSSWDKDEDKSITFHADDYTDYAKYDGLSPMFKKILLGAVAFFIVAAAVTVFIFYKGSNVVSPDNIDIALLGPVSTPSGEPLSLEIDITNRNSADLQLADLVLVYPDGTRSADDGVTPMVNDRLSVDTIPAHGTAKAIVKSILFGQENDQEVIKVRLEYRVAGSNTIFVKEKDYPIYIGSSPISLAIDSLSQVTANSPATFTITVTSNSTSIIKGLLLKADYPFGFQYSSSTPTTVSSNDTWALGDMQPGDKRVIVVTGQMIGQNDDTRSFTFSAGTEDPTNTTAINTVFVTSSVDVSIQKPFLGADISLNGDGTTTVAVDAGTPVRGEITWQNNLDVSVNDVVITEQITGPMLDKTTVGGGQGFYDSSSNTLEWDKTTLPDLADIVSNGTGRVQFSFASLQPTSINNSTFRHPEISIALSIKAKRLDENNVPQEITSTVTRDVKIQTGLTITPHLVRNVGPFQNTGPLPPVAEQASTYTVLVNVANSFNLVKDAVFTATLPPYVTWLNTINPGNSSVAYNSDSRIITWNLGQIPAGTGYNTSAKQFAFQVSLLPSVSQVGTDPEVITSLHIAGVDDFTNTVVTDDADPLDTKIESDPTFVYGQDKVNPAQ